MYKYKKTKTKKYYFSFIEYIKIFNLFYYLKKNFASLVKYNFNNILKINYNFINNYYKYYFLKNKNTINYAQLMFLIKSNTKQYFLSFLGFNVLLFKTASTGKILKRKNLTQKSLKSSKKAYKYLLLFFNEYNKNKNLFIHYYYLKPVNRKNLIFFYLILKNYKINFSFIGYKNYYKICNKNIKRIKKKIKKKLLKNHTYYL